MGDVIRYRCRYEFDYSLVELSCGVTVPATTQDGGSGCWSPLLAGSAPLSSPRSSSLLSPSLLCMHAQIACTRANVDGSILDGWRIGPGSQGLRLLASDVLSSAVIVDLTTWVPAAPWPALGWYLMAQAKERAPAALLVVLTVLTACAASLEALAG